MKTTAWRDFIKVYRSRDIRSKRAVLSKINSPPRAKPRNIFHMLKDELKGRHPQVLLHADVILLDFKGTVAPDIGLHFSFWKIKLVLSAEPLMVLTFFYFVVPEIFKNLYLNCFYENTY
jgi:hypothetical protein